MTCYAPLVPRRPRRPSSPIRGLGIVRGPDPTDSRRWYWRLRRDVDGQTRTLWSGWATVDEAEAAAAIGKLPEGEVVPFRQGGSGEKDGT